MKNKHLQIILSLLTLSASLSYAEPDQPAVPEPVAVFIEAPEVPVNYSRWGVTGEVVVSFEINQDGRTRNIRIESHNDRQYAMNVEKAVRRWRFESPELVGVKYRQTIRFH